MKSKKKFWEVVKKFPAVSYAVVSILLFIFLNFALEPEVINFELETPNIFFIIGFIVFVPSFLLCIGLSNIIPSNINQIIFEAAPFVIFILICLTLDLLTHLLRKILTNLFGKNLITKITTIILTLILWVVVFVSLISSLPIDT